MKIADIELPQGAVPQEVLDWMDNVRLVLNNGRYQQRVIDSIPTWSTHSGETLLYQSDTVRRQYAYINDQWCYFGFVDSDGTILVDGEIEIGSYLKANDTDGLWLGHADWASAPFRVNLVGALWATSANITGSVVASAGNIGGWDISAGAMTAGAGDTTVGMRPATYPFYSGASTPSVAPFRVDVNGNLVAESGFIGGWAITTDGLYTGSGGTRVKIDDGPYPFSAGSEDVGNAPFWVSRTGQVKCSNIIISGLAEGSDVSGIYISADSISANSMNVTELSAISANMGTVTAGTITAAIVQTSADPALSRVRMDSNGLWGYDSVLGQTFKIPTDGSSPIFASGQIQNATIVNTTIYDTDFYSASELPWIQLTSAGLRYVETLATGKYGSGVQYGDGTLYGTGYTATIFNSAKPLFNVEAERAFSDLHLYNRSAHSSGASTVGDLEVKSGVLYLCTTAGTPGTFTDVIGASKALDNLASVAINESLISDATNTDDLGSSTYEWRDIYFAGELYGHLLADKMAYMCAGDLLSIDPDLCLLFAWITPATTEQDLSPHNHDGTYQGSMTTGDQIHKGLVWALDMDASDDYVSVADHADFSFDDAGGPNGFTMGGWVQVVNTGGNQIILSKWDETTGTEAREWQLYFTSTEALRIQLSDESIDKRPYRTSDDPISTGWRFVIGVYDGGGGATAANGITLYVDGVVEPSTATNDINYVGMEDLGHAVWVSGRESSLGALEFPFAGDMGHVFITTTQWTADQVWEAYIRTRGYYNE